ncbi:hypothetical protein PI124_g21437 [Phytophthora idaei]|nr:hypothetical protein PI125_g22241 [Phytophthora idaei]KAG3125627.1 hypothetical protein PI126_g22679 [Phytophthora idaei]KAG3233487.1 hypothetical protein PI124_g21437 [Phytophthora idaei]
MAKDYQAAEKKRRAKEYNDALSRLGKAGVPRQGGEERSADGPEASSSTEDAVESPPKSLFEIGSWRGSTRNALNPD